MNEQEPHPRPLEHCFGDDGERDDRAQLQSRDGDDRDERVLERVAEVNRAIGQAAGTREFDVIGTEHFKHFGAHEAHDQRHLKQRQCDRRQDQRLETARGQESRGPPSQRDGVAATK